MGGLPRGLPEADLGIPEGLFCEKKQSGSLKRPGQPLNVRAKKTVIIHLIVSKDSNKHDLD